MDCCTRQVNGVQRAINRSGTTVRVQIRNRLTGILGITAIMARQPRSAPGSLRSSARRAWQCEPAELTRSVGVAPSHVRSAPLSARGDDLSTARVDVDYAVFVGARIHVGRRVPWFPVGTGMAATPAVPRYCRVSTSPAAISFGQLRRVGPAAA